MKQKKSAKELADMIANRINDPVAVVEVGKDPSCGWRPSVTAPPHLIMKYESIAQQYAEELREQFELDC